VTGQEFNELTIALIVLIGRYASHTNAAPLEELRRLLLQRCYAADDPNLPEPSPAKILEASYAAVCRVDEVAAWLRTCPAESKQVQATTARTPSPPTQYLLSWRDILDAVGMPNNSENRVRVRNLNKEYEGPISLPRKGGQPKVVKDKLLIWWDHLEILFKTSGAGNNTKMSVETQYPYGKDGTVIPDISGHIKKRRRKKSD
jgi:hypothetical protein